jgi:hypothetical protein
LFARARQCAYPGCDERLILEHRGQLTVVAEIAHIRSESADGPRHDPAYPAELINEEENLLLLCGTHHKPVDDHESLYPVDELLRWKREQTATASSNRDLTEGQVERIFLHYDLDRLGHEGFEKMCQALTVHVLGPGTEVLGGYGRHNGDAAFDGQADGFPSHEAPWDGYIVMEAMYSTQRPHPVGAKRMLGRRIENEFERWAAWVERGNRRPDYLIFATNLQFTADDGELEHLTSLIDHHAAQLGLRGWLLWDETRLGELLDAYPDVRHAVSSLSASNEIVAGVLARLSTASTPAKANQPGEPGQEAAFQPAYDAAGGLYRLGTALGQVQPHQLGWLQHFSGGTGGEPAVLCALYGKEVVAVATPVWNDVEAIGDGVFGGGAVGAGFPVFGGDNVGGFIGSDVRSVELAGGRWGPEKRGRLLRSPSGTVLWQPELAFDSEASKDRDAWSSPFDQWDLRIRVAARIPLSAKVWRISGRARMLAAVDATGMAAVLSTLADQYSLRIPNDSWQEMDGSDGLNNSRFAAYHITVATADGRPALALCLRLALPTGRGIEVHTAVDLRVNFSAFSKPAESSDDVPAVRPLKFEDLTNFFVRAWPTATVALLLAAVENPLAVPPAGAPRLEFHIGNEDLGHSDRRPTIPILDMVDLSPVGSPRGTGPSALSVGVTTPLGLSVNEIRKAVDSALVWMVEDAGFVTLLEPT